MMKIFLKREEKNSVINKIHKKFFSKQIPKLKNFINGEFVDSKANTFFEITNPATNKILSFVPETPNEEFENAVSAAKIAFKTWRNIPINTRQRYMFDYIKLLKDNQVIEF